MNNGESYIFIIANENGAILGLKKYLLDKYLQIKKNTGVIEKIYKAVRECDKNQFLIITFSHKDMIYTTLNTNIAIAWTFMVPLFIIISKCSLNITL